MFRSGVVAGVIGVETPVTRQRAMMRGGWGRWRRWGFISIRTTGGAIRVSTRHRKDPPQAVLTIKRRIYSLVLITVLMGMGRRS